MERAHIPSGAAFMMVVIALVFDAFSIIPLVNIFIDVIATAVFTLWFAHYDTALLKRRGIWMGATFVVEIFFGFLPTWTLFVVTTLILERLRKV